MPNTPEEIALERDMGRKCADDVASAIHRNMSLVDGQRGKMLIATYGAATAIGAANGAFSAFMGGPNKISAEFVDQLWSEFLRPMVLGQLPKELP